MRFMSLPQRVQAVLALHGWRSGPEGGEFERVVGAAPLPRRIDLTNLADANRLGVASLRAQRDAALAWPTPAVRRPSSRMPG